MLQAKVEKLGGLTPREARVLAAICEGKTDQAIANHLAMSIKTVECHVGHIYDKLQVRSASVNARCATIATVIARGMVRLTNTALCLVLMVGAMHLDSQALRVGRVGAGRSVSVRVKTRRLDG